MRGDAAGRVHHVKLAMLAAGVGGGERLHHVSRGLALAQQLDAVHAVERIGQRLRGDRADAGLDVRHAAADREVLGRDRDAEAPPEASRAISDQVIQRPAA